MASKKAFKSQASSSRAFLDGSGGFGDGVKNAAFGAPNASQLSHVYEPPDLGAISDPNVVVSLKNIQKKDSTTKSKALDDLQSYVQSLQDNPKESLLEAWVKVFPRTSIDNSRRVRQQAHGLQGHIAVLYGKRFARHMSDVIGAWIVGLFDNDKSVSKSAQESFRLVFSSEEKYNNVWKIYQSDIACFCKDFLERESPNTLSDERTTSPDDANSKFSRTLAAVIVTLTHLIERLPKDVAKCNSEVDEILNGQSLWKHASNADSIVRRAVYRLLLVCTTKRKDNIDPNITSPSILTSALHVRQIGSSLDYARAVSRLTSLIPSVWTVSYQGTGKRSARARLSQFLKHGSQNGPPEFWTLVGQIIKNLPSEILLNYTENELDLDGVKCRNPAFVILDAFHRGVSNLEEPRSNSATAWAVYLEICDYVCSLSGDLTKAQVIEEYVDPIVCQYVHPSSKSSPSSISSKEISLSACQIAIKQHEASFLTLWSNLSVEFMEHLKVSQPEQSKDHKTSQEALIAQGQRWYGLYGSLLHTDTPTAVTRHLTRSIEAELEAATSTLTNRNGKPYGIAATIKAAAEYLPREVLLDAGISAPLQHFVTNTAPSLILGPSAEYIVILLDLLDGDFDVKEGFRKILDTLENAPSSPGSNFALRCMFASKRIASEPRLMAIAGTTMPRALNDDTADNWNLVRSVVLNTETPQKIIDEMLASLIDSLNLDERFDKALDGLEMLRDTNLSRLQDYASTSQGVIMLSKLLALREQADDVLANRAQALEISLQGQPTQNGDVSGSVRSSIALIQESFSNISEDALSVAILTAQATTVFNKASPPSQASVAHQVMPNQAQWSVALTPFLSVPLQESLATCAPFGSALYLIKDVNKSSIAVSRDAEGQSLLFRIAQYASNMIQIDQLFNLLPTDQQIAIGINLLIVLELANDDLSVPGSLPLCITSQVEDNEVLNFVATSQHQISSWLKGGLPDELVDSIRQRLLDSSYGTSLSSYYHGRALARIAAVIDNGLGKLEQAFMRHARSIVKQPDVFMAASLCSSTSNTSELLRLFNEIITQLTGQDFSTDQEGVLRSLVLLNCILSRDNELLEDVPQQRTVFFVKHASESFSSCSDERKTELLKAMQYLLPQIKEIYGSFWDELLHECSRNFQQHSGDEDLPLLASSLRICDVLRKLSLQESNEDLTDSWTVHKAEVATSLLRILVEHKDLPDQSHQPRRIVNDLLQRLTNHLSENISAPTESLYAVMASESEPLQNAAYDVLQRIIPSEQEEISLEKALDNFFEAKLPEELLSLILAPPILDYTLEERLKMAIPVSLRSYLLSWKLTLLHWEKASNAVQQDYAKSLSDGHYTSDLLDFIVDLLITSRHKPFEPSGVSIGKYELDPGQRPDKDLGYYLAHLFYLILLRLPSPSKIWWRESASRQKTIAVESWTEKHISPHIISLELTAVKDWASSQDTAADTPLNVKVSQNAKEITASIPIDERTTSISIRLPQFYPLARAEVTGLQRVGVAENKWQSWIRNAQGQLTVSDGGSNALIDCLLAWRRNVTAAMKGQTECAICYSVVGADKTLPKKECPTCKNRFHAGCLFRWFKSSNSSSCPLCRNTFAYS